MLLAFIQLEWNARYPKGYKTSFTMNSSQDIMFMHMNILFHLSLELPAFENGLAKSRLM